VYTRYLFLRLVFLSRYTSSAALLFL
ncbi:hypothetical protein MPH_11559, partial [Macrophomina phaseolina MS6]